MHTFPEPKSMFEGGTVYAQEVTLRAYMPNIDSKEEPLAEISWSFRASRNVFRMLQAYQELTEELLEVDTFTGKLKIFVSGDKNIVIRLIVNPDRKVNDILLATVDLLHKDVIEHIIDQEIDEVKHKLRQMEEVEI